MNNAELSLVFRMHRLPIISVFIWFTHLQWPLSFYGFIFGFSNVVVPVCLLRMLPIYNKKHISSVFVVLSTFWAVNVIYISLNYYTRLGELSSLSMYVLATDVASCMMKYTKLSENCLRRIYATERVGDVPAEVVLDNTPDITITERTDDIETRTESQEIPLQVRSCQSSGDNPPPYWSVT